MIFGDFNPKVKDLTQHLNTWTKDQVLANKRPAASSSSLSDSPSTTWEGNGWSTGSSTSIKAAYRVDMQAVPAATGYGNWRLRYSVNNAAYTSALTWNPLGLAASKPLFTMHSYALVSTDNSSTVDTLLSLDVRSSGSTNHIGMSTSGTTRASWSSNGTGQSEFKVAGSNPTHNFYIGSSIGSQSQILQVYSSGIYNYQSIFNGGRVTAGSADTTAQTYLSTYGSFAVRGSLVTSSSYTMGENETFVYVDPSQSNFCQGTPTGCNTYMTEGNCNAHTGVGCSWSTGTLCSTSGSGTDSSTCTSQGAGCVWDEVPCSSADNTDQSTCENQDDTFGGGCTWDVSTCPAFTTIATCNGESGCTSDITGDCTGANGGAEGACEGQGDGTTCAWTGGDCHAFDATDQATCETSHTGCTWDGGGSICNGVYDEGSVCAGTYFVGCTGNLCNGNYNDGTCSGSFGAGCLGTANCGNIVTSGSCAAEAGCAWVSGVTITLPTTANASRGTTGRIYSILHVGNTGTVAIQGQSGEPVFQYTTLNLLKKGDKVLLHNQNISFPCSLLTTQSPCEAQSPCVWLVVCSTLGDQTACEAASCSWDGDLNVCTGRTTAVCSGSYDNGSRWYAHSLERGLSVVEKTANYTLTAIDDIVKVTANSVTLTLPSAALNNGKEFKLKNRGSGVVTLATTSGQTIDGNASSVLTLNTDESMTVVSNNVNWEIY
jgi:hypothetical protein